MILSCQRRGTTLIELLIFMALFAVVAAAAIPLLFAANENRLLQQTIATVEQNGTQILDMLSYRIRQVQRVYSPTLGNTGSLLTLYSGSGGLDPIIIGVNSGSIVIVRHAVREIVSSQQVAVERFLVRNTSLSSARPSVTISFMLSRTIRLQQPRAYRKTFETTVNLFPIDRPDISACVCDVPACAGNNVYTWSVWDEDDCDCYAAATQLQCP